MESTLRTTAQLKIRSHLALLIDNKTKQNGSGVLIQLKDRMFILTAAHVLADSLGINLGLPCHETPLTILDVWKDDGLDIAFLELKPFEVEVFRADQAAAYKVSAKLSVGIQTMKRTLALCGYPSNQHHIQGRVVGFVPLFLGCALLGEQHWPEFVRAQGKDPSKNFVVPMGRKYGGYFHDAVGNPLEILPQGMSGCGLWYFDPDLENSEHPLYGLVGILHSHFPQDQVLVGTFAEAAIDAICNRCRITLQAPSAVAPPL